MYEIKIRSINTKIPIILKEFLEFIFYPKGNSNKFLLEDMCPQELKHIYKRHCFRVAIVKVPSHYVCCEMM